MSANVALQTQGIHHLGLTVPSLEKAIAFFTDALNFQLVGEKPEYPAAFVSDGTVMITLWQSKVTEPRSFNRHENIGLHHFALAVADTQALAEAYQRLKDYPGVEIEFAPESLGGGSAQHMMCLIPGGLRMEMIAAK